MTPVLDCFFPRHCPVCDELVPYGTLIHKECEKKLVPLSGPVCMVCGRELASPREELCDRCRRGPRPFDKGRALLLYNDTAMTSMSAVKYKNKREYLDFYAAAMGCRFARFVKDEAPDVLIPVPIHPARRRIRGFNQAEELASRLFREWNIPVETGLLLRVKNTDPLKGMGAAERKEHLKEAFAISPHFPPNDIPHRVLLIDDIYTTGTTIEACASVLKTDGVKHVSFLTICMGYAR